MLFYIAVGLGFTVFMFVIMCAESVGHNRLTRIGFIIAAIGVACVGLLVFYAMYINNRYSDNATMEQFNQYLNKMDLIVVTGTVMWCLSIAGVVLIFIGAAQQTWRNRKKIFAFAYR
ncbi:MAG: hypothetical protein GY869_04405 [Planctomycetes bacterium]|nr:hypothetical protein [Planctomycetota bacterium]